MKSLQLSLWQSLRLLVPPVLLLFALCFTLAVLLVAAIDERYPWSSFAALTVVSIFMAAHLMGQIESRVFRRSRELLASERHDAVYAFAGFLTTRDTPVTFSRQHDAAEAADLCGEFMQLTDGYP